jgi:isoleucyl-tRNA synthetase
MADRRTDDLELRSRHDPVAVEPRLFARWESAGLFRADPKSGRPSYVIALPPPNVTGELHMGHALNGSIQDALIRLARMRGRETLWICGTDHASIAVHAVIEKQLRAEGLTRFDLGREAFIERVWAWRSQTGATIIQQYKRLGCALDYENERFTMDDGYARAVLEMFVRLPQAPDLPRQPDRELVSRLWIDRLGPRGAPRARRRRAVRGALPDRGQRRAPDGGDGAPGDDPGRHRRGRASR